MMLDQAMASQHPLSVLQIGMNWLPDVEVGGANEVKIGGLDRVYFNLINSLSASGVAVQGLVVGTPSVSTSSNGRIVSFARSNAYLPIRLRAVRNAIRDIRARSRLDLVASHFAQTGLSQQLKNGLKRKFMPKQHVQLFFHVHSETSSIKNMTIRPN
jgi:hypothetical protein